MRRCAKVEADHLGDLGTGGRLARYDREPRCRARPIPRGAWRCRNRGPRCPQFRGRAVEPRARGTAMEGRWDADDSASTVTPEAVQLHADVAGVGSRTIALILDSLIQGALLVPVLLRAHWPTGWTGPARRSSSRSLCSWCCGSTTRPSSGFGAVRRRASATRGSVWSGSTASRRVWPRCRPQSHAHRRRDAAAIPGADLDGRHQAQPTPRRSGRRHDGDSRAGTVRSERVPWLLAAETAYSPRGSTRPV